MEWEESFQVIIADMDPTPKKNRESKDILIENVQHVASYNWVDEEDPTIIIPEQGHFMDSAFRSGQVWSSGSISKRLGLQPVLLVLYFFSIETKLWFFNELRSLQVVNQLRTSPP